jgi:hypothetical protein
MAFSERQTSRLETQIEAFLETRRPKPEIRDQLDLGYRIEQQSVFLFTIRPQFGNPSEKTESPVAKTTYVRSRQHWKVYWMRRNFKWYRYDPKPTVPSLNAFFEVVDEDEYGCFWG